MKYINTLLLLALSGCISPTIEITPQDTASQSIMDTAVVEETGTPIETGETEGPEDTQDTEDTEDTQDTSNPNQGMTDIGLRELRDEYLWFDGSIALLMNTKTEDGDQLNEFPLILNPMRNWGVGVTLAPYNEESKDLLFDGGEVELFSGHNGVLTLEINEVGQYALFTIRLYFVQESESGIKSLCAVREFPSPANADLPQISDLLDGFQILMFHEKDLLTGSNVTLVLQRRGADGEGVDSQILFEDVSDNESPSPQCNELGSFSQGHLIFGGQTPYVHSWIQNTPEFQPLRARVDNLILFNSTYFSGIPEESYTYETFYVDNLSPEIDNASFNESEDGWGWWPFDLSDGQGGDYHFVRDETMQMQTPGMSNFYIVGNPMYNEIDSAGAAAYYYNENTHALSGQ